MTKAARKCDSELAQAVLSELAWDTRVKASNLGVRVDDGIVTLTGIVDSYGQKLAAAAAAHRVHGALDVANEIEVAPVATPISTDAEVAQAVRNVLMWNLFISDDRITTTVADGVVTLEGDVDNVFERREAEDLVKDLAGVRGVHNHILVKPPLVEPEVVKLAVEDALERRAIREADRIKVTVVDGCVELTGVVRSWGEKRAVLGAASHAPGVRSVDDRIRIDASS